MSENPAAHDIAVVILSYGPRPSLPQAVRSVVEQDMAADIVVVHSGPGDPRPELSQAGLDVRVILVPERLYAGGARNVGIAATTAPFVAFLSDDQLALPGWARGRVVRHRAGCTAVASATLPHRPRHPTSLIVHLILFLRRMPLMPARFAHLYGLSYTRAALIEYGPFDETLRIGEDTDFNRRLPEGAIEWAPEVQSVHLGLERAIPAMRDQYRRARRRMRYLIDRGEELPRPWQHFRSELRTQLKWGPRVMELRQRRIFYLGLPILVGCLVARALGVRAERRAG